MTKKTLVKLATTAISVPGTNFELAPELQTKLLSAGGGSLLGLLLTQMLLKDEEKRKKYSWLGLAGGGFLGFNTPDMLNGRWIKRKEEKPAE